MIQLAQLSPGRSHPEIMIGIIALLGLLFAAIRAFARWLAQGPEAPDPWDKEISEAIKKDDTMALCHRCLVPHDPEIDFCPECGAAVGQYTNWLPFPQLFSVGHLLRIGTAGEFKHTPLVIFGFFLLGVAEYMIFAPVYWFVFFKNLPLAAPPVRPLESTPSTEPAGEDGPAPSP